MSTSVFLEIPETDSLHSSRDFFIVPDKYPVSSGHLLIISKQYHRDFFELTDDEKKELPDLITIAKLLIEKEHNPTGYNIGINCGALTGQTVFHFHCHVIPRYDGDMDDPQCGIRFVIPEMGHCT